MKMILIDAAELEQLIERSVMKALALNTAKPKEAISDVLSINEAAALLKLSKQTLYRMTSERRIPFTKTGKALLFSRAGIEQYIRERATQTADQIAASSLKNLKRK